MLNAIKFKVKWGLLLGLLFLAWLINTAASAIIGAVELSPWATAALVLIGKLSGTAFVILGLVTIGAVALAVAKLFPGLFALGVEEEAEVITEAEAVTTALDTLGDRLDHIEHNRDQAIIKLQDADMLAHELVGLIRRTVAKARDLAGECEIMEAALDAMAGGDSLELARAAGRVNDNHIRDLLLETSGDGQYRASVLNLVATQTGALRSQSEALGQLSNRWIESLTRQRAQTARLVTVIDALDAARPIASIEANLQTAQRFLMLQDKPEAWEITRNLPTPAATRPMIEGHK